MLLKNQLIHSIEALLVNAQDPAKINRLLKSIKSRDIQNTKEDYEKTFWLIFLIYFKWIEIRNDPTNALLKNLGNLCLEQLTESPTNQQQFMHQANSKK